MADPPAPTGRFGPSGSSTPDDWEKNPPAPTGRFGPQVVVLPYSGGNPILQLLAGGSPGIPNQPGQPQQSQPRQSTQQSTGNPVIDALRSAGIEPPTHDEAAAMLMTSDQLAQYQAQNPSYGLMSPDQAKALGVGPAVQGGGGQNPLALQLYFQQTIAPLLSQIQGRQDTQTKQYTDAMGALMNHVALPENMRGILQANMQTQVADMQNVNNATASAALTAPFYDQLMNQVNNAYQEQVKTYMLQKAMEAAAAAGTAGVGATGTTTTGQNPFG